MHSDTADINLEDHKYVPPSPPVLSPEPILALWDSEVQLPRVFAAYLGVTTRTVSGWRSGRGLELRFAEEIADRIGMHPSQIWGREYAAAIYAFEQWNEMRTERKKLQRRMRDERKNAKQQIQN